MSATAATTTDRRGLAHWLPMLVLAAAQFVMVLDSTVMNVSISTVVKDLHTTVADMQLAIACFTLVMAAFMLAGAGIGNRLGRLRTFRIGLVIYAIGSGTTALAVNFPMLFAGWSVVEGLGAVLVIPAIAALTAANYTGRDRAIGFGILGGVAGAAAAAGPVIGGYMTTYLSWRYVFAAEVVICLAVIAVSRRIATGPRPTESGRFDLVGVGLSAVAFGTIVISLVKAGEWGWVRPRDVPFTVLGFAPTLPLVIVGLFGVWAFLAWEHRAQAQGGALLDPAMLRIGSLADGLATLTVQQFTIGGLFFVLPLYLQLVLGFDALDAGLRILPLSIALFVASFGGAALASRVLNPAAPKAQAALCANGFRDTTRIASGSPEMWRDIVLANRKNLSKAITLFISDLQNLQHALSRQDEKAVTRFFETAKQRRDNWCACCASPSPE